MVGSEQQTSSLPKVNTGLSPIAKSELHGKTAPEEQAVMPDFLKEQVTPSRGKTSQSKSNTDGGLAGQLDGQQEPEDPGPKETIKKTLGPTSQNEEYPSHKYSANLSLCGLQDMINIPDTDLKHHVIK